MIVEWFKLELLSKYALKVYSEKEKGKVHVLQGMQGIEVAMKRFFYAYKQVVTVMMGSSEADNGFTKIFLEPTYFPSLDAAKTFLAYYWENNNQNVVPC